MRYWIGFALLSGALLLFPPWARAQGEGPEPWIELKLESDGFEIRLESERLRETRSELDRRVGTAMMGPVVGGILVAAGGGLMIGAAVGSVGQMGSSSTDTSRADALLIAGSVVMGVGAVTLIATGILFGVRKRELRRFDSARIAGRQRVRWDVARARLEF